MYRDASGGLHFFAPSSLISGEHGLQTPNKAFFHRNPELLGLDRQNGQINSGAFGVFSACPCFLLFNLYFNKRNKIFISKSQIFIWNLNLNFGRKERGI